MSGFGARRLEQVETCWLCCRELGRRVEWHHPVPKSRGGKDTVPVHPICHATLHRHFSNTELAAFGPDVEALRRQETIARFLRWIDGKPPEFHAPTRGRHS
jgi:hypothetical protein